MMNVRTWAVVGLLVASTVWWFSSHKNKRNEMKLHKVAAVKVKQVKPVAKVARDLKVAAKDVAKESSKKNKVKKVAARVVKRDLAAERDAAFERQLRREARAAVKKGLLSEAAAQIYIADRIAEKQEAEWMGEEDMTAFLSK